MRRVKYEVLGEVRCLRENEMEILRADIHGESNVCSTAQR